MKHSISVTASILLLSSFAAVPASGQAAALDESLVQLGEFAADGGRVPAISRQFLDDGFVTRDLSAAFDNGRNYTASLAIPDAALVRDEDLGRGLKHRREVAGAGLRLYLTNLAEAPNDIAVSAVHHGAAVARNALVRVEPGEVLGLAADDLAGYDEVRLLSIQDFAATAVLELPGGEARRLQLDTAAPSVPRVRSFGSGFEKSINYCQAKSNVVIEITNDSNGSGVLACAQRTSGGGTFYQYAIDYPTCGDPFHCKTSGGSVFVNPPCKMLSNTTRRCSDSSIEHNWRNLDETVFSCGVATAKCTQGCTGTFTITCP